MSAIACVFHRHADPASATSLARMMNSLQHHGPDGAGKLVRAGIALGFQQFCTLPEEGAGEQPFFDSTSSSAFAFDGRLDNRAQLMTALGLRRSTALSDAALARACYRQWGEDAFRRMLGPFALVAADLHARSIILARDALGDRSLFYHLHLDRLVVASEPCAVLCHPDVATRERPQRVAAYFNLEWPADGSSFFVDVEELPPGHYLAVSPRSSRLTQYWRLRRSEEYRRWRPATVQERYRELLDEAVACRLRSRSPVAVSLSGGLDSTSIAAFARRHQPITAYSFVFDTLPTCDERIAINKVTDMLGVQLHWLLGDELYPLADPGFETISVNSPDANPFGLLKAALYATAAQRGHRVMLNGDAGDTLLTGKHYYLRDAFAGGELAIALPALLAEFRAAAQGSDAARKALRRLLPWNGIRRQRARPQRDWLKPAACAQLPAWTDSPLAPSLRFGGDRYAPMVSMFAARTEFLDTRLCARAGVERRSPFRDRRLVEFVANLPQHHLHRPGVEKRLARDSMAEALPAMVTRARRSGLLYDLFLRGLIIQREQIIDLLTRTDAGWRDYVASRAVDEYLTGRAPSGVGATVIWLCVCYELWRRKVYTRRECSCGVQR